MNGAKLTIKISFSRGPSDITERIAPDTKYHIAAEKE